MELSHCFNGLKTPRKTGVQFKIKAGEKPALSLTSHPSGCLCQAGERGVARDLLDKSSLGPRANTVARPRRTIRHLIMLKMQLCTLLQWPHGLGSRLGPNLAQRGTGMAPLGNVLQGAKVFTALRQESAQHSPRLGHSSCPHGGDTDRGDRPQHGCVISASFCCRFFFVPSARQRGEHPAKWDP